MLSSCAFTIIFILFNELLKKLFIFRLAHLSWSFFVLSHLCSFFELSNFIIEVINADIFLLNFLLESVSFFVSYVIFFLDLCQFFMRVISNLLPSFFKWSFLPTFCSIWLSLLGLWYISFIVLLDCFIVLQQPISFFV